MENYEIVAALMVWALLLWIGLIVWQISLLAKRVVEAARARDYHYAAHSIRRRNTELLWTIPGVSVLSICLAFGVDAASRSIFESQSVWGWTLLVVVIFAGAFAGLGIVYGIIRKERPDYAAIRADLSELEGQRLTAERVAEFRALLDQADQRQRMLRIGRASGAGAAAKRAELEEVSESFSHMAPTGTEALKSIRWSLAISVFWRQSVLGLATLLVSLVPWVTFLVVGGVAEPTWLVALFLATPISIALGIAATRAALAARTAQHAVYLKQRAEVVHLLEEFDRSARKGVAGLGDRVARALQILRDQQG